MDESDSFKRVTEEQRFSEGLNKDPNLVKNRGVKNSLFWGERGLSKSIVSS